MVKNYNYFSKALHPRSLTGFWICLSLINFYSDPALCIIWYIFRTLFIIVNSDIFNHIHALFRHIQPYCGIFRTLCNSCIFKTLSYSKSWQFITQDVFRTLSRHILIYSKRCVTLAYWDPYYIQNVALFRILAYLGPEAYSKSCLFMHIQAYSGIFNNNSKSKKTCFLTIMTLISMPDWVYLNN